MATTPLLALQETYLLTEQRDRRGWLFHRTRALDFKITSYLTSEPLIAATLDEPNADILGLDKISLIDGIRPYQDAALAIRRARGAAVPALFWRSKHREAIGLVVAIFHESKTEVGLKTVETMKLLDHALIEDLNRIRTLIIE
jgi:hypothetical protein